jgi:hypothetical protein
MNKTLLTISLTLSLLSPLPVFAGSGWYFGDNCESIKSYSLKTPLELISEYGCKPNMSKSTETSADMGMLAFDCSKTDLKGYVNLIFTKERCIQLKNYMNKMRK